MAAEDGSPRAAGAERPRRPTACWRSAPAAATSPRCSRTARRRSYSVEIKPALAAFGRANLERHGADNVTLEIGDAARGWPGHAPYDVIVLTGSTPLLPQALARAARARRAPVRRGRRGAGDDRAPRDLRPRPAPGAATDLFETVIAPLANAEQPSALQVLMKQITPARACRLARRRGPRQAAAARRARALGMAGRAHRGRAAHADARGAGARRRARPRRARWSRSAITAAAASRWRCSSRRTASPKCTTCRGASMPGRGPSTRRFRFTRASRVARRCCRVRSAAAEDLLQVYRDAQRYDAVYAAARHSLEAGRERLPQGRALLLPTLEPVGQRARARASRSSRATPRSRRASRATPNRPATRSPSRSRSSAGRTGCSTSRASSRCGRPRRPSARRRRT